MGERYGYSDDIAGFVDMKDATPEGGTELLPDEVVALLNKLDTENTRMRRENEWPIKQTVILNRNQASYRFAYPAPIKFQRIVADESPSPEPVLYLVYYYQRAIDRTQHEYLYGGWEVE